MADELFDVVDEHDSVIGRNSRSEVHRLGLLHRAVHVLVFDGKGRVLLQKRVTTKDCNPGLWDSSVGGHVDSGEEYDAAMLRETAEELGITPTPAPHFLFKINACEQTGWEFVRVYQLHHEGPFTPAPAEIDDLRWFAPPHLDTELHHHPQLYTSSLHLIWQTLQSAQ